MHKRVLSLILLSLLLIYAIPVGAVEKEGRTWKDERFYSIVVDRFFDGNSANNRDVDMNNANTFNGGDFVVELRKN